MPFLLHFIPILLICIFQWYYHELIIHLKSCGNELFSCWLFYSFFLFVLCMLIEILLRVLRYQMLFKAFENEAKNFIFIKCVGICKGVKWYSQKMSFICMECNEKWAVITNILNWMAVKFMDVKEDLVYIYFLIPWNTRCIRQKYKVQQKIKNVNL